MLFLCLSINEFAWDYCSNGNTVILNAKSLYNSSHQVCVGCAAHIS